ncbi:dynein regulatory complex protein 9 [Aplysia californica]|uniref:Dynein regulatory complex protein 9 n=1 Tax=Aplysia californica TaxID=6500 RepID=A0ABM0K0G0_APLCA|nr:dynein regulatory complex protein 9 [Aplysia californica]
MPGDMVKANEDYSSDTEEFLPNFDPTSVPLIEAVNLAVVFEDFSDQLDILGRSIVGPEIELRSKPSVDLDRELHRPVLDLHDKTNAPKDGSEPRYLLKQHYEMAIPRRIRQGYQGPATNFQRRLSDAIRESYLNTLTTNGKLQVDRGFLQKTVQDLMIDIIQKSSFECLVDTIETEKAKKEGMRNLAEKSVEDTRMIKQHKREIKLVRKEKVTESRRMDRFIWSLEDATQELLIRTKMEALYVTKTGAMITTRSTKICKKREKDFTNQLEDANLAMDNEYQVHQSMMEAIRSRHEQMQIKLDYWMDKYEVDKENLQNELDTLKANRAKDLELMAWLKHTIYNYNQICQDHRRIRAIQESRTKRSELENKKSIKIQAWWRGTMVRRKLGPFKPKKEKKEKKSGKKKK